MMVVGLVERRLVEERRTIVAAARARIGSEGTRRRRRVAEHVGRVVWSVYIDANARNASAKGGWVDGTHGTYGRVRV